MTGFDHICCIKKTEKSKYNEYTKYTGTVNVDRAVGRLCAICCSFVCAS